jgi:hypothetical protein
LGCKLRSTSERPEIKLESDNCKMKNGIAWTEDEARAAVSAYFKVLQDEQDGVHINKAGVYRALSKRFPKRVPKAFELKFQNISAILYEQRLPYCSGLKPRHNYQKLLRLLVLDRLARTPLPAVEPHEILFLKLRELSQRGPMLVNRTGSGRFGLLIEEALGIKQNSDKAADFMGIELKTKSDASLQTLFSLSPTRFVAESNKQTMFRRHSYFDRTRNRQALYTSFSKNPDSLGFRLAVYKQRVQVFRKESLIIEYDAESLEEALLAKHTQTAYLTLTRGRQNGAETCTLIAAQVCKWPSIIRFLRSVSAGDVFLDFTMAEKRGRLTDHGFLWRIRTSALGRLYLSTEMLDLQACS